MGQRNLISMVFYQFELDQSKGEHLGGTGIYLTSLNNFLQTQQDKVLIRIVRNKPSLVICKNTWQKLIAFLSKHIAEIHDLLRPNEQIMFLHYPKIPIVGRAGDIKALLFAIVGYGLLALKKTTTKQWLVVLIQDLPSEQRLLQPSAAVTDLTPFYKVNQLPWREYLFTYVERLIFKSADVLVSPSNMLSQHIVHKHNLCSSKILLKRRDIYMPTYQTTAKAISLNQESQVRIFYSGDLSLRIAEENIRKAIKLLAQYPKAYLYLCGKGGDWITSEVQRLGIPNVQYLGLLDHATHDLVAKQCDIGLLLYEHSYYDLMATAKYSAYVACGLAILSTDLATLTEIIQEDGVGIAAPISVLLAKLEEWLVSPQLVTPFKAKAIQLSKNFTEGLYMQEWFAQMISKAKEKAAS